MIDFLAAGSRLILPFLSRGQVLQPLVPEALLVPPEDFFEVELPVLSGADR